MQQLADEFDGRPVTFVGLYQSKPLGSERPWRDAVARACRSSERRPSLAVSHHAREDDPSDGARRPRARFRRLDVCESSAASVFAPRIARSPPCHPRPCGIETFA